MNMLTTLLTPHAVVSILTANQINTKFGLFYYMCSSFAEPYILSSISSRGYAKYNGFIKS